MAFHFASEVTNFLFKGWTTHSIGGFVGVCIVVALATLLIEGFKVIRTYLTNISDRSPLTRAPSTDIHARPAVVQALLIPPSVEHIRKKKIKLHVGQTFLHVGEVIFGYLVMLAVMSYNTWIVLTVALASGVGYFFLGFVRNSTKTPDVVESPRLSVNTADTTESEVIEDEGGDLADTKVDWAVPSATDPPSVDQEVPLCHTVSADVHL